MCALICLVTFCHNIWLTNINKKIKRDEYYIYAYYLYKSTPFSTKKHTWISVKRTIFSTHSGMRFGYWSRIGFIVFGYDYEESIFLHNYYHLIRTLGLFLFACFYSAIPMNHCVRIFFSTFA